MNHKEPGKQAMAWRPLYQLGAPGLSRPHALCWRSFSVYICKCLEIETTVPRAFTISSKAPRDGAERTDNSTVVPGAIIADRTLT